MVNPKIIIGIKIVNILAFSLIHKFIKKLFFLLNILINQINLLNEIQLFYFVFFYKKQRYINQISKTHKLVDKIIHIKVKFI
jgi:hypothetical protein